MLFVLLTLKERSTSSCNSINWCVVLSNASSNPLAGKGSFSTKSNVCVKAVSLNKITVSVEAGTFPDVNTTLPPDALPTLVKV